MNYFNYFSEIEETFIRLRGKSLLLSPLDWTLIESWQKRGIPQHVVIRSIEKIFADIAKDPKRNPSVKSIAYCTDEVEQQYRVWLSLQAGAGKSESLEDSEGEGTDPAEFVAHLNSLITGIEEASAAAGTNLAAYLNDTLEELRKLKKQAETSKTIDAEMLETKLTELETALDKILLAEVDEVTLARARKAVEEHLGQYKGKMQQEVYDKTFELMVVKKLRERARIPAFSLFYL